MVHKTVLKVNISCEKCKKILMRAVSGLEGVDKVEIDAAKGTLTVTGNADPYKIIVRIRKTKKLVEIVSIGPPPPPPKPDAAGAQKKPDAPGGQQNKPADKKPDIPLYYMHTCQVCEGMRYNMGYYHSDPNPPCSVM